MENKLNRNYLIYKTGDKKKIKTYDFQKIKTIRSFGRALEQLIKLKYNIDIFKEPARLKELVKKEKNDLLFKMQLYFLMEDNKFLMFLKVVLFPIRKQRKGLTSISDRVTSLASIAKVSDRKFSDRKQLEILTYKQALQRFPIPLAQVNEIRRIACSLYQAREIT